MMVNVRGSKESSILFYSCFLLESGYQLTLSSHSLDIHFSVAAIELLYRSKKKTNQ